MLLWFVIFYLMISVGIGLYAATRVHNAKDFAVAGRSLPVYVVTATVFATWFGAEAVFGVPATFVENGLTGVAADPFGSSMCLVIAGILFSRYLYRLNIITLGDFYRMRYSRPVEVLTSLCIVAAYLGWVAAQIKALGLIFYVVTDGTVSQETGMILGTVIVLTYTTFGGMFSVAILDFVQMFVSMSGLFFIAWIVSDKVSGGAMAVIDHASLAGKLDFFPEMDPLKWITFLGAWVTMMLGSIPQQDVFQRITSAKSATVALWGSVIGATIYFCFAFVPMFIAYSATLIDPMLFAKLLAEDSQLLLPTLVLQHTPLAAQVLFFGAVISAIMSCSSATLLAPSVTFAENVIKGFWPNIGDHQFLWIMRATLVSFGGIVLAFALNSDSSIFEMVESAYKVTLAGAFVPLLSGIFWKRATTQGALAAIFGGLLSWLMIEILIGEESLIPPQLVGLSISAVGMIAGSLLPQWVGHKTPGRSLHELQHYAASETHHIAPR
ncbi:MULTISPECIES: sodium:solute symporter family protein [Nitrosomonas]|uniref:Na+/proline symporter n=1 Tax=Nitrosomonas communis TaxID=44574 RepID=A0A0F7KAP3_9PROT|nr:MULTISPECIES: sodium:solute symporter family protein [Nitrosomonas]AKH36621.1 sodium:solute symporter [Nitrosomonas communis]TYP91012.1 Na+/proline symporter [Nitrosomonas communis]UVS61651.1 sodium:solute symporter family protein [Nitrosomonas sp. PLL12]